MVLKIVKLNCSNVLLCNAKKNRDNSSYLKSVLVIVLGSKFIKFINFVL